jgi:hypothetical protein
LDVGVERDEEPEAAAVSPGGWWDRVRRWLVGLRPAPPGPRL